MSEPLVIENDGSEIVKTNFWQTEQGRRGYFFLSLNAGAFRLLVPRQHEGDLGDWKGADQIVISRGPWVIEGQKESFEILFDDNTDSPYSIHLGAGQFDRLPLPEDEGREFVFSVWFCGDDGPLGVLRRTCKYRKVEKLPLLKPWK